MHVRWHKVTWYSKLLALFVFGAAFFTGFIYGVWYEKMLTRPLERELDQKREIVNWLDRANLIHWAEDAATKLDK